MQAYLMEAIGTFFLVLVFGITGDPFAIGFSLIALVFIGYSISGGHYNPAVSLAFFFKRRLTAGNLAGYIFSQILGGFLAAFAVYYLSNYSVFYLNPPSDTHIYQQSFLEVLLTAVFVMVMLVFSLIQRARKNPVKSLVIGLTYAGMLMVAMPVSGGVLNPAISLGSAAFDLLLGGNSYVHSLLYTLAPLTGGALAAFAFTYLNQYQFAEG